MKKYISLLLMLTLLLAGCGKATPAKKGKPTENREAQMLEDAVKIADQVVEAVMVYDLKTITQYSVLTLDDSEQILDNILGEIRLENGEYEWDGLYCGTYADFVEIYDREMSREYAVLEITQVSAELCPDTAVLQEADARELLNRDEAGAAAYREAVSKLPIDQVAVVEYTVHFQDQQTADPHTGEPETYEEMTVFVTVYMVQIQGQWLSYSPTIAGTFPPLGHFPRYTAE